MSPEIRHSFNVSSDSSGILARPRHWQRAWGFAEKDPSFGGFEALAWGGRYSSWSSKLLDDANEIGVNVTGLHGRTGGVHETYTMGDRFILEGLNRIIVSTPSLVKLAPRTDYILVHGPELRNEKHHKVLEENRDKIKLLYVENHIRPGADGTALSIARDLRRNGVNAGVMFDLYHYLSYRNLNGGFKESWSATLDQLSWMLAQKDSKGIGIPVGVHVPMGTKADDSLPIDKIDKPMWKNLGEVLKTASTDVRVVIENQQTGINLFLPVNLDKQADRNKRNMDTLRDGDVI